MDGDMIYVKGLNNRLLVLDSNSGEQVNSFAVDMSPNLDVSGNYIYARAVSSYLYKIDKYSGEIIWSVKSNPTMPVIDNDKLYYYDFTEKKVIALSINGIDTLWDIETSNYLALDHAVSSKYLFFRREDRTVIGVNKLTGEKLWQQQDINYLDIEVYNDK